MLLHPRCLSSAASPLLLEILSPAAGALSGQGPGDVGRVAGLRPEPDLAKSIEAYFAAFPGRLRLVCPPLVIEGGERGKNSYFHVTEIHSHVDRYHIDRHSYIIAAGGGALLDVAGLAASTRRHRGVRHVRIPTTTLSQADSGVGVKNGIN